MENKITRTLTHAEKDKLRDENLRFARKGIIILTILLIVDIIMQIIKYLKCR
jgi:hypothetical protein